MNTELYSLKPALNAMTTQQDLTFGEMMSSIRICENESQTIFSRKLGISKQQLCNIEKERRLVTIKNAAKFAEILGYSSEFFVALSIQDELKKSGMKFKINLTAA